MTAASETQQVCTLLFSRTSNAGVLASNMQSQWSPKLGFLALHSGDILTVCVRQQDGPMEPGLVVTVDSGLVACAWSPDDEVKALVTGEARLLLKTQDFDVVDEFPLVHGQQGEEAPVVLVGGKRETQYHGKAGKAAVLESSDLETRKTIACARMDDSQMRILWCGDSAFISVSFAAQSGARELRVFLW
ncbi:putative elongator complex protein 1 [Coemansia sp. 'formosensis']|nr:putative elongator complex protein 1 [Coemansia sp. 'formosensis']